MKEVEMSCNQDGGTNFQSTQTTDDLQILSDHDGHKFVLIRGQTRFTFLFYTDYFSYSVETVDSLKDDPILMPMYESLNRNLMPSTPAAYNAFLIKVKERTGIPFNLIPE